jgi:hypothetical protein
LQSKHVLWPTLLYWPGAHAAQGVMGDAEYFPMVHELQLPAPVLLPVFVTAPAIQSAQSLALLEPVAPVYLPDSQSSHASTFDAVEYLPTPQAVHKLAAVSGPLLVIEPAAHSVHDATFDAVEYMPAAQAEHELAPVPAPVLVIEPA